MHSRYRTQKCVNGRDCVSIVIPGKSGNFPKYISCDVNVGITERASADDQGFYMEL